MQLNSNSASTRPLDGMLVLDFSQFLAGPVAAMRLADLGARVIKIERPKTGDLARSLAFAGIVVDGDTLSFQIMNRNKQSLAADLKDAGDLATVKDLVRRADVIVQNFRPGVMERLGLDFASVQALNPRLVYASVTGYGDSGPWRDLPGQDLLAQALSGLAWLNGRREDGPVPVGASVADHLASCNLTYGIVALLLRRERTGFGGLVETSLMEAMLDLQFESLSARLNDANFVVERSEAFGANAFLAAPYGVYPTKDGFLAIAMSPVPRLGELVGLAALAGYEDPASWWTARDEIGRLLAAHLSSQPTSHWLAILQPADVWCAPVLTLPEVVNHEAFKALAFDQEVRRLGGPGQPSARLVTTRVPLRIDGAPLSSPVGAPRLGEHSEQIRAELGPAGK